MATNEMKGERPRGGGFARGGDRDRDRDRNRNRGGAHQNRNRNHHRDRNRDRRNHRDRGGRSHSRDRIGDRPYKKDWDRKKRRHSPMVMERRRPQYSDGSRDRRRNSPPARFNRGINRKRGRNSPRIVEEKGNRDERGSREKKGDIAERRKSSLWLRLGLGSFPPNDSERRKRSKRDKSPVEEGEVENSQGKFKGRKRSRNSHRAKHGHKESSKRIEREKVEGETEKYEMNDKVDTSTKDDGKNKQDERKKKKAKMQSIDLQSSDGENFEEEGEYVEKDALSIKEEKPDRDDHREDEYGEKDVKDKVGIKKNQYALSYEEDLARPWSSPCTCTCRDYMLYFLMKWAALRRRNQIVMINTERKILKTKQISWTTANRRRRRRRRGQKGAIKGYVIRP